MWQTDRAVLTVLPQHACVLILIDYHKLKLHHGAFQLCRIDIHHPFVVVMLCHGQCILDLPVAQSTSVANEGQALPFTQLWSPHLQSDGVSKRFHRTLYRGVLGYTVGKCRTVEISIFGHVDPVVVKGIILRLLAHQLETVRTNEPFMTTLFAVAFHAVIVVDGVPYVELTVQFITPVTPIMGAHVIRGDRAVSFIIICHQVENNLLTEYRQVFYVKYQFHRPFS